MAFSPIERAFIAARRAELSRAQNFTAPEVLTPRQLAFVSDKARFKLAVCGRGAGKSSSRAFARLKAGSEQKRKRYAYVTGTRRMAKNIFWPILLHWNKEYSLGWVPNWSDLTMTQPNTGSYIQLSGANTVVEVDKLRGQTWDGVDIDEAQSLGRTLETLIKDATVPRLVGDLTLSGTPGPVPVGPFFDAWKAGKERAKWSVHEWTARENPYFLSQLPDPLTNDFDAWIREECERRGCDIDDPGIQREFFAVWARDLNALVLLLTGQNYFTEVPELDAYVIGVDLGFDDSTAISVQGWSWTMEGPRPKVYQVEETLIESVDVTTVGEHVRDAYERYAPLSVAVDTAGIGKMVAAELANSHWGMPITPFDKTSKTGRAKLLRAAIDRGEFVCKQGGHLDHDAKLLQWETDPVKGIKRLSDKSPDDKAFHSDIVDAAIGAYMETMAQFGERRPEAVPQEDRLREERREARARKKQTGQRVGMGDMGDVDLFGDSNDVDLFG